jgi:hypothetical protein
MPPRRAIGKRPNPSAEADARAAAGAFTRRLSRLLKKPSAPQV